MMGSPCLVLALNNHLTQEPIRLISFCFEKQLLEVDDHKPFKALVSEDCKV